ncbi:ATP-binding protein [Sorangium sp. So ce269]
MSAPFWGRLRPVSRWFNTAGACLPADHYILPTRRRLPEVRRLIEQRESFVVHAPRRVGKTTSFLALAEELTAEGRHVALLVSTLAGADRPDEPGAAELAILHTLEQAARAQLPLEQQPPPRPEAQPGGRLDAALRVWAQTLRRPLVVFLDDVDAFRDSAMDHVLRQLLRASLGQPAAAAPWTLALLGLRGAPERWSAAGRTDAGAPEPLPRAVRSITLPDFTREDVAELYQQHTEATGQRFERAAVERAFALSRGQPWLVNALAKLLVEQLVLDRAQPVSLADVERAGELLLAARGTPLGRLAHRLHEPRLRAVFEPMLAGTTAEALPEEDVRLAAHLGLVRLEPGGAVDVANPIYRELIARTLALSSRASLPHLPSTWLRADGHLDLERLLDAFVGFWRRHGEALLASTSSPEIAPYMVMTAFLDRVASGGGTLERTYGIGRGRMDLCLRYGPEVLGLTLKVWREGGADPLAEGLEQLEEHLAGLEARAGWLVLFDQRTGIPPVEERVFVSRQETSTGRAAVVLLA